MKKLLQFCGAAVLAALLQIASADAISLSVSPAAQNVDLGDSTSVDIVISGLDAAGEIVSAFDLDVFYDETIVTATGVSFGPYLGDLGLLEAFVWKNDISVPGIVDLAELSLLFDDDLAAIQPDTFTLATIFFGTADVGTSPVTLFLNPPLNDVKGRVDNSGFPAVLDLDVNDGSITVVENVNPTPEPGTIALFGTGLVGMLGYGWYRRKDHV